MINGTEAIIAAGLTLGGGLAGAIATYLRTRPSRNSPPNHQHKVIEDRLARGDERFKELSGDIKEQGQMLHETREKVIAIEVQTANTVEAVGRIEDRLEEMR